MFENSSICKLLISCPSDIKEEKRVIEKIVQDFNDTIGLNINLFVKTLHWLNNMMPESSNTPQIGINRELVEHADIAVAIFGNRAGSPTDDYDSGTIEEIEKMIAANKQVFVYFSDKCIRKSEYSVEEDQRIQEFKDSYKNRAIYWTYNSVKEFKEQFTKHLNIYLIKNSLSGASVKTRFDEIIKSGDSFNVLSDYLQFSEVNGIVSYGQSEALGIHSKNKEVQLDVDVSTCSDFGKQEFVMGLIKYVPPEDWSKFYENNYALEFSVIASKSIIAVQLEIKDEQKNKIVDKKIIVSDVENNHKFMLQELTRTSDAWHNISELCFTIFINLNYLIDKKGAMLVKNLKLSPFR